MVAVSLKKNFFQAEDGIRDVAVTGVQTCALPILIVVDPPRKGCEESLLQTIVDMQPEKVVYVSCDSATLARDVKFLRAKGYELKDVTPVDQFPHTVHVETVVLLSQLK